MRLLKRGRQIFWDKPWKLKTDTMTYCVQLKLTQNSHVHYLLRRNYPYPSMWHRRVLGILSPAFSRHPDLTTTSRHYSDARGCHGPELPGRLGNLMVIQLHGLAKLRKELQDEGRVRPGGDGCLLSKRSSWRAFSDFYATSAQISYTVPLQSRVSARTWPHAQSSRPCEVHSRDTRLRQVLTDSPLGSRSSNTMRTSTMGFAWPHSRNTIPTQASSCCC